MLAKPYGLLLDWQCIHRVMYVVATTPRSFPHQVRGPMQLDANGDVKNNRSKLSVRHFAKVSSEGFVGDKQAAEFSGYEHKVGCLSSRGCVREVMSDVR